MSQRANWLIQSVLWVTLVIGLLNIVSISAEIGRPFGGFLTFYNLNQTFRYHVDTLPPAWWSGMQNTQLEPWDQLITIDKQPYQFGIDEAAIYENAILRQPPVITIEGYRNGKLYTQQVEVIYFSVSHLFDLLLPDLIIGLGFWLVGLALSRYQNSSYATRVFILGCCAVAGSRMTTRSTLFLHVEGMSRVLYLAAQVYFPWMGVIILHFAGAYPTRHRWYTNSVAMTLNIIGVMVSIVFVVDRLILWQYGQLDFIWVLEFIGHNLSMGMIGIGMLLMMGRHVGMVMQRESPRLRRQAGTMLIGLLISSIYIFLFIGGDVLQTAPGFFWLHLDIRYLLLAAPLAMGVAIVRYELFGRTNLLLLTVPLLGLSGLLAMLGSAILLNVQSSPDLNSPFPILFSVIIVSSLIWLLAGRQHHIFGRILSRRQSHYAAASQFGQKLFNHRTINVLGQAMTRALTDELEVEQAAIWLWDTEDMRLKLLSHSGAWRVYPPATLAVDLAEIPTRVAGWYSAGDNRPKWFHQLREVAPIEVVVPMWMLDEFIGLLVLSKRWDEALFDESMLEVIELIRQQSMLAIVTLQQIEQLRQVPYQVASAQEQERFKIAQELHDTVQQFLGRLPFYLDISRNQLRVEPEEAEQLLDQCIIDVEAASHTVRQIRNNLAPSQLKRGFRDPIASMLAQFEQRYSIHVRVDLDASIDSLLPLNARHALYRMIQQALDNVQVHADATHVSVRIWADGGFVRYEVADDGCGISAEQLHKAQQDGAFGIASMEARIRSVGGAFSWQSSAGAGTTLFGYVPIQTAQL